MTADETLFTTGQAIWGIGGTVLQDIVPVLESAVWVGHTLYGVRAYPFFGHRYLRRDDDRSGILSYAAKGLFRDDERDYRLAAEGLRKSARIWGGADESGREDEIVHLSLGEIRR